VIGWQGIRDSLDLKRSCGMDHGDMAVELVFRQPRVRHLELEVNEGTVRTGIRYKV
jgi:hypothetical protein